MRDSTLQVMDMKVAGEGTTVTLQIVVAMLLPVGEGRLMPIPLELLRVPIDRSKAEEVAKEFTEAVENTEEPPPPSSIQVASGTEDIRRAAEVDTAVRGGNVKVA